VEDIRYLQVSRDGVLLQVLDGVLMIGKGLEDILK
jgi:hypothetical protein